MIAAAPGAASPAVPSAAPTNRSTSNGIGLRTKHFARFMAERPPVDWVEAVTENFMAPGGRPFAVLEKVRCFAGTPDLPAAERVAIYSGMYL